MKKGQVTLFVVLGIIILAVVSFLVYNKEAVLSNLQQVGLLKGVSLPPELENLKGNVQRCVEDTFFSGLIVTGLNGGNIVPSENSVDVEGSSITYWNNYGRFQGPTLNNIGSELEDYMGAILPVCINLDQYKKFKFNDAVPQATVNLGKDKVNVVVNYNLVVDYNNASYSISKPYTNEVSVRFGSIYNVAKDVINYDIENPGKIDVTSMLSTGMNINVLTIDNQTIVYSITDANSKLDGAAYTFNVASRFKK